MTVLLFLNSLQMTFYCLYQVHTALISPHPNTAMASLPYILHSIKAYFISPLYIKAAVKYRKVIGVGGIISPHDLS